MGNKIGQIVFEKITLPELEEVSEFDDQTERDESGFGSSNLSTTVLSTDFSSQKISGKNG